MNERLAWPFAEFCKEHGISRTSGYKEVNSGRLKITKVGSKTLVTAESRQAWLDALARLPDASEAAAKKRSRRARAAQRGSVTSAIV